MSPDHVSGSTIDRRADVFAAGVLLRELITNRRLWGELEEIAIVRRLVAGQIPKFPERETLVPGCRGSAEGGTRGALVSRELRAIAEKAMTATRADRYATADEMREALDAWLDRCDRARGSLAGIGARLAGAIAGAAEPEITELSTGALVTDTSSAPRSKWRFVGSVAAAAIAMVVASTATLALVRDALVVDDAPTEAPSAALATQAAPPPALSALPEPPAIEPATAVDDDIVLPPNPYEIDSAAP
jgi:hypothetical protein